MEMSMRFSDDAVKIEFVKAKEKLNEVQIRVKGEINDYLDELFEEGGIFKAIELASEYSKEIESF
jgi:hypothetical protein